LTAAALDCLSDGLSDQAAVLTLASPEPRPADGPLPQPLPPDPETCLAELDHRLSRAALVAESDAMTPGLEKAAAGLLWTLAALYHSRGELLLVCTLLDSA
jgi:hypothetical protein